MRKILSCSLLAALMLIGAPITAQAAFVNATSALGTAGDTITINVPTNANGDEIICAVETYGNTVNWGTTGFTTNATFTTTGANGRASSWVVGWKVASSEPSTYTVTEGGGNGDTMKAVCGSWSGRNSSGITSVVTNEAASGSSPLSVPLTGYTAVAGDDVAVITGVSTTNTTGTWTFAAPSGYTSQASVPGVGQFYGGILNVSSRDDLSSGATGTLTGTATLSGNSADAAGVVIALPAAGGSACTNAGYEPAGGIIAVPNGTSGTFLLCNGHTGTPDCSTVTYYQPHGGKCGVN